MRLKKYITIIILFLAAFGMAQSPPDAPLTPQEWIDKMGIGSWWIFNIPPDEDTNIKVNYSSRILDSLQTNFCINGGRLHWVAQDMYDENGELLQEAINNLRKIIDDFMERDMAISLNVQFLYNDAPMTEKNRTKMKNAWAKLSDEFKDVSHNLAMCPVIEFHGWADLDKTARRDSLNELYHDLTIIFREKNPTRIMSYKPWGSARRAEFYTLDFPFGNDPLPGENNQFYYVASFSGSAGMGDWNKWYEGMPQSELDRLYFQTMNAGISDTSKIYGMNAAIKFRDETGIPFWCDHWRPNYHKAAGTSKQWSMEQNLAYVEFFENKLLEINSAGAGLQTRTFWDDETDDLIRLNQDSSDADIMAVKFMELLHNMCIDKKLGTDLLKNDIQKIEVYPNPFIDKITLKGKKLRKKEISIYDVLGNKINNFTIKKINEDTLEIHFANINKGLFFVRNKKSVIKIIKLK